MPVQAFLQRCCVNSSQNWEHSKTISQQSFLGGEWLCEMKGYSLFNQHCAWKDRFLPKKINGLQRQEVIDCKLGRGQ